MNKREIISNFIFYVLGLFVGAMLISVITAKECHAASKWPKGLDITEVSHVRQHLEYDAEPTISILQGSDRNTSLVVVTWPDGKVDKLLYNNRDADRSEVYGKWFEDRLTDYERRQTPRGRVGL